MQSELLPSTGNQSFAGVYRMPAEDLTPGTPQRQSWGVVYHLTDASHPRFKPLDPSDKHEHDEFLHPQETEVVRNYVD